MTKVCRYKGCKKTAKNRDVYCGSHNTKVTVNRFLGNLYRKMRQRVSGISGSKGSDLYVGKPIMPKDVFMSWAKNHPDFLSLYKRWVSSEFDRKLTPTVNRMNSAKGYLLGNVEWLTNSQNCGLSGTVVSMKAKKEIYNLLGVNTDV